jgi:peptidoglycan/xylan/chitin deacetylase (PgdA/CDA1 family)
MPTLTSTLPPLAAAPVAAKTRLRYVLEHFALAYPGVPAEVIGYADAQPLVEVAAFGEAFFRDTQPYPAAPSWREWQGRRVPFFFDQPAAPLLVLQDSKAVISADLISAAFYLLSGWQEYFSTERDRHGRFPYAASVQHKYGFVALPVVNYYFDVLRAAVEHVSGQPLRPRRWGPQQAGFAAFISHDIDNLYSGWKAPAKAALQQRQFGRFGKLLWQHLTRPDAWNNLEAVAAATAQYGAKSTFFILPAHAKASNGTPNADYKLTGTSRLQQRLWQLTSSDCELNIHGPIGTAANAHTLATYYAVHFEKASLPNANGIRFHYLSWEPRQTPAVVDKAGFNYDSTLGFAEHFGFRHSYCLPFYPFDFSKGKAANFLEIPLNVMDTTLHHPSYLQLAPDETRPTLAPVFAEIKRFGGVASVLWHNENFDPANVRNGPRQFHEIMAHLQAAGAAFRTGREIWEEFTAEPAAETQNS